MNHLHMHSTASAAKTTTAGRTISWGFAYDHLITLLTLNRENVIRDATLHAAGIQPGNKVLDVGCGTGTLTLRARALVGQAGAVYGIDAAPQMIEVARRKAARTRVDATFQAGVIEALDFGDNTFDVVLSSLMMHHLPGDVKSRGLMEIRRVLKPGGTVLIADFERPANLTGMVRWLHHDNTSDLQQLIPVIQQAGFDQIETGQLPMRGLGYIRARRMASQP